MSLKFSVFFICLLLMPVFQAFSYEQDRYISVERYTAEHPEQSGLMKRFSEKVASEAETDNKVQGDIIKIALVYPGIQKSSYWRDSIKAMEARLGELGIKYELLTYLSKPYGDFRRQVFQLSEAFASEPDYLAVSVDNENIRRLITAMLTDRRTKIFIQNMTTPLADWTENPPYMYIGFDHHKGAGMIAEHYSRLFPGGAKYLLLYGSKGAVSTQRGDGFERTAMTKGLQPAAKFYTDFSSEKAYSAVKRFIERDKDFDFIYACSTDIAIGAAKALQESGLSGKKLINGWGGTPGELELIKDGILDFTVMRMNDDSGTALAEAIKNDLTGNKDKTPQIFSGEFVTVTKEMSDKQIEKLKERALRYSGK